MNRQEEEILTLVKLNNPEIRFEALKILLTITSTDTNLLIKNEFAATSVLLNYVIFNEENTTDINSTNLALDILINGSSMSNSLTEFLLENETLLKFLANAKNANSALKRLMLLSNLTLTFKACETVASAVTNFYEILGEFCLSATTLDNADKTADYKAYIIRNCTQLRSVRDYLLTTSGQERREQAPVLLCKFFSLTHHRIPFNRREAAVDILRNCCFDSDNHETLIKLGQDFVVALIGPLAGPEQFDDEDNEKLPIDLQYLSQDKVREPEDNIRIKLLETLYQLCSTKESREFLRNSGVYYILREYHKWETNPEADRLCGDVVNVLIRTENEIGCDNLHKLENVS